LEKLLNEPNATGKRARQLPHEGLKCRVVYP
jgi:hypothetical protein